MKKTFTQKQIPTLLGMLILVVALIGGIFFIGKGGGIFAPRATAETTPKKATVTNVKDDSFSVSFFTQGATAGFIKYGTDPQHIESQASDDRDQFSGNVGQFNTHQITLHDLQPETTYYYTLGTTTGSKYDNNGQPYSIKTPKKSGNLPIAKTIYGTVNTAAGTPASGVLVYVTLDGAYQLSALTKDSGSWAIPLANARTIATGDYREIDQMEQLQIMVQGNEDNSTSNVAVNVVDAQPVSTITIGQDQTNQSSSGTTQAGTVDPTNQGTGTDVTSTGIDSTGTDSTPITDQVPLDTAVTPTPESTVVEVNSTNTQVVQTAQPVIQGTAAPNVLVSIEIHSTAAINTQVQTDSQGNYTVNLQQLEQQLDPGEHTITVTYPDPNDPTKTLTQTQTFTVQSQGLIAAITPSPTPFSTSNPFVLASPSPSPIPTLEPTPSPTPELASPTATTSVIAKVSTESALPRSGSTTTTLLLVIGGAFFILTGGLSYWATARHSHRQDLG